ncbi:MAG TPA: DoxX family protein [Tepidisphaeraceae bacterium]|nr:DoxX family protein [Tepidisphaeraceae bacterium]
MNIKRPLTRFWLSPAASNAIFPSIVLLIFRLAWGWELLESGWGHWTHIDKTLHFFISLGVPLPGVSVYVSATTELLGGALIMLGLATRFISIPLFINFCVAYMASPTEVTNFFHQDPANFINDSAFPFLITSLLLLAFGAGVLSADYVIALLIPRAPNITASPPPQA